MYGGLHCIWPEDRHHLGGGVDGGAGNGAHRGAGRPSAATPAPTNSLQPAPTTMPTTTATDAPANTGAGGDAQVEPDRRRGDRQRQHRADLRRVHVSGTNDRTGSDADGGVRRDCFSACPCGSDRGRRPPKASSRRARRDALVRLDTDQVWRLASYRRDDGACSRAPRWRFPSASRAARSSPSYAETIVSELSTAAQNGALNTTLATAAMPRAPWGQRRRRPRRP